MKILHTSDWHLGRSLYDKKRYDEFGHFLDWLGDVISREQIDLLLVAGDVFDTSTPGNRAQELYYNFLADLSHTCCRHVVIIGGNHDSPTFLNAPKSMLQKMNIYVVGAITDHIEDEVFVLKDAHGLPEAIVCAIPYLRDRDIRTVEAGENPDDKLSKLLQNIAGHYKDVMHYAHGLRADLNIPVIGMGHLFTTNAKTTEDDGVRELYVGTIAHIDGQSISEGFDYMALGHLHIAQKVGDAEHVRYCGSPIPMGFGEASQTKYVLIARFEGRIPAITPHAIPRFRELIRLSGDLDAISERINLLKMSGNATWLELEIASVIAATDISAHVEDLIKDSNLEVLRIRNKHMIERALHPLTENETLDALEDTDVFSRCLDAYDVSGQEREALILTYAEAKASMLGADPNAD